MLKDTRTKRLAKFKFIAKLSSDTQRSLFFSAAKLQTGFETYVRILLFLTIRIGSLFPQNSLYVSNWRPLMFKIRAVFSDFSLQSLIQNTLAVV